MVNLDLLALGSGQHLALVDPLHHFLPAPPPHQGSCQAPRSPSLSSVATPGPVFQVLFSPHLDKAGPKTLQIITFSRRPALCSSPDPRPGSIAGQQPQL